jgi:two-component system cell cycle sensor histidine kinase/response regulator CckA
MKKPLRMLLVEDSLSDVELLLNDLDRRGYDITYQRVDTAAGMKAALEGTTWDAVVSDYSMPQFSGMEALKVLQASGQDLPFIIVSGTIGEESAVNALKAGAHDFLVKGNLARLVPAIERERREVGERRARALTQEALSQSESRFRSLVEHAVFGIFEATLEGRFLAVNPALVTMLGYATANELLSVHLPSLCMEAAGRTNLLQRVHALKPFTDEEMTWRQKSGTPIRVRLSGRAVETPGGLAILDVFVEDITERDRLAEQLRQAQKMEGIGRLAGGIAHDFNNMLTTIMGYSDMIVEQIGPDKPISADLLEIRHAADRAAGLTRQLLAFSRQQVLRIGAVDINAVVDDMRALLQRVIGEDVTIALALASGLGAILADRVQLEQVLMNLASNARDAMPTGGHLTIGTSLSNQRDVTAVTGSSVPPGRYITLTLSDTGEGMDARTRERVFEPFFTTKELGKGTGLGLATVYGIVRQLDGYIGVTSQISVGTTFTMFFPEAEAGAAVSSLALPQQTDVAVATSRDTVLVVEDEPGLRKLVVRTLSRHGYEVLEAATGQDALAVVAQAGDTVRLVVSDVVMPVMNGPEMARHLRASHPDLQVIYMSGYAGETIRRGGLLEEHATVLGKPFTAHELLQKVRELLNEG